MQRLYNLHKGEPISVIGGGASLDKLPRNYFYNSICVFVNHSVCLGFCGRANFLVAKEPTHSMQFEAKLMGATIVAPKYKCGAPSGVENELLYPLSTVLFDAVEGSAKDPNQIGALERTASTIVTGMHLALFLGASEVNVYGHDCKPTQGRWHARGYSKEGARTAEKDYGKWLIEKKVEETSLAFQAMVRKVWGVEIYFRVSPLPINTIWEQYGKR